MDDTREFKDVEDAFTALNFSTNEKDGMYDMVGAILALGNCTFQETKPDECEVVPEGPWLETAAELLQLDASVLGSALVRFQKLKKMKKSEGAAREWSTVVIVIVIFIT